MAFFDFQISIPILKRNIWTSGGSSVVEHLAHLGFISSMGGVVPSDSKSLSRQWLTVGESYLQKNYSLICNLDLILCWWAIVCILHIFPGKWRHPSTCIWNFKTRNSISVELLPSSGNIRNVDQRTEFHRQGKKDRVCMYPRMPLPTHLGMWTKTFRGKVLN